MGMASSMVSRTSLGSEDVTGGSERFSRFRMPLDACTSSVQPDHGLASSGTGPGCHESIEVSNGRPRKSQ